MDCQALGLFCSGIADNSMDDRGGSSGRSRVVVVEEEEVEAEVEVEEVEIELEVAKQLE